MYVKSALAATHFILQFSWKVMWNPSPVRYLHVPGKRRASMSKVFKLQSRSASFGKMWVLHRYGRSSDEGFIAYPYCYRFLQRPDISFPLLFSDADVKTKHATVKLSWSQERVVTALLVFVYVICQWERMTTEKLPERNKLVQRPNRTFRLLVMAILTAQCWKLHVCLLLGAVTQRNTPFLTVSFKLELIISLQFPVSSMLTLTIIITQHYSGYSDVKITQLATLDLVVTRLIIGFIW